MAERHPTMLQTADGRELEVVVDGSRDGLLVIYHSGTPSAALTYPLFTREAQARGLRLASYSRPGYAGSTPRFGRSVADAVDDVQVVADNLEAEQFLTFGWSGGGPHALACAALLGERCLAAATVAGVAPYDAEGLDWLAGMGQENVAEFTAARAGVDELTAFLSQHADAMRTITTDDVADSLGGLVSDVDKAAITGELADYLAGSFRRAVSRGTDGWRDDDLAFCAPWGFDTEEIAVPVSVWQGTEDKMVPHAHGAWLAEHVSGARANLLDGEGQMSLAAQAGRILDDLLEQSRN